MRGNEEKMSQKTYEELQNEIQKKDNEIQNISTGEVDLI